MVCACSAHGQAIPGYLVPERQVCPCVRSSVDSSRPSPAHRPRPAPHPRPRHQAAAPFSRNSRSATYRSTAQLPLRPWHVRNQRFHPTPFGRRGLDPDEVQVFLDRVAYDLHQVYAELAASRDENVRIKNALRQWQTLQAPRARDLARQR